MMVKRRCPKCERLTQMSHDQWEDMYRCAVCEHFWYPEELGLKTNKEAGIFHIGEKP